MTSVKFSTYLFIALSFVIVIVLNIIPLPPSLALFYPLWLPLILIYWVIALPEHIPLSFAWILGLLVDVLQNSFLGEHGIALCIITFLAYHFHRQVRMFSLLQQTLFIFLLLFIYQCILVLLEFMLHASLQFHWVWFCSLIVSALFWPLLNKIMGQRSQFTQ